MTSRRRGLSLLLLVVIALTMPRARAQDRARVTLKVGGEHDTNARRLTGDGVQEDQLVRVFFKGQLDHADRSLGQLSLKLLLGAKTYREVAAEDTAVSALNLRWTRALWRHHEGLGLLAIYARGDVADRSERSSIRDYTRAGATAGLSYRIARLTMNLGGGWRTFLYKPDAASHHEGATLESSARVQIADEWSTTAYYSLISRGFDVERVIEVEGVAVTDPRGVQREDTLHAFGVSLSWSGAAIIEASYSLQLNRSNSFGPGLIRHGARLAWTQPLPWDLVFDLQGQLQRTAFDDPVRVDATLRIDDENRNILQVTLRQVFWEPVNVELRYALYTQAFGDDVDFVRQLVFLGLGVHLDTALSEETSP